MLIRAGVPETIGIAVSVLIGAAVAELKAVGVKLGIEVNVPVGRNVGVDEGSIVGVKDGEATGEGLCCGTRVGEDRLMLSGLGIEGRQAANTNAETRATQPARATLFMPFLGRSDDLHELRDDVT